MARVKRRTCLVSVAPSSRCARRTGEFIVAAGRTEDGDIREVDLEMEIGAIADASRVRKMDSVKIYYLD